MALDFWDYLNLSIVMSIQDYYNNETLRKSNEQETITKLYGEIADASEKIFDEANGVFQRTNPNVQPEGTLSGAVTLPFYGFMQVISIQKTQGRKISPAQDRLLDIFFKSLSVGISKNEFLYSDAARNQINELVKITEEFAGLFWVHLFKAIYITGTEEKVLTRISQLYTEIILRFAILGGINSEAVIGICNSFNKGMQVQFEKCAEAPESDVDFMGEVTFEEHGIRTRNIVSELSSSEIDGGEGKQDMLDCYLVSLIWEMLRRTRTSGNEKVQILDYAMEHCCLDLGLSSSEMIQGMKYGGQIKDIVETMLEGFLVIITGMSYEYGNEDMSIEFCQECAGYLIALEKKLASQFPNCGFKDLGPQVMLEQVGQIAEKVKPDGLY